MKINWTRSILFVLLGLVFSLPVIGSLGKWDPLMASDHAVVDTNGVKWIDGKFLPLEGRAFADTESYYDRLPRNVSKNVNEGVREMKSHTSGMLFRFRTDSRMLLLRWQSLKPGFHMRHMTDVGSSGVDVYRRAGGGPWRFVTSSHRASETKRVPGEFILQITWTPGEDCIVNLPLYNGIREFALGIDPQASVEDAGPHRSGVEKPVVFYGTSITHGGCATRPGLGFVNIIGRRLDVPVVGLGFSGSGWMEYEMSEHLARIDASCYVLDCLGNMDLTETERPGRAVTVNYEKFIRNLRRKRPDAPIVMAEQGDVFSPDPRPKDRFVRALYEKLVAEGWKRLVYLPKDKMFSGDTEGTVDGVHPNDLGMMTMAEAYGGAVRAALELPER